MAFRALKSIFKSGVGSDGQPKPFSGVATVLLSYIVGFEIPSNAMDPATLAKSMNNGFAALHRCIEGASGVVVSSVGDAALAVWGASFVVPSHAELALKCGLKIVERFRENESAAKPSLSIRIVLATGKIDGRMTTGRFQIFGDPLAAAKRLENFASCKQSRLLCTSETLDFVPDMARSEPVGKIKGASGAEVAVFEFY